MNYFYFLRYLGILYLLYFLIDSRCNIFSAMFEYHLDITILLY